MQDELAKADHFAPFVCAGPNGSGKSNLLEVLAAIFFQLEILRVRRSFLPEALQDETLDLSPISFELDYLIRVLPEYRSSNSPEWAKVHVRKNSGESVRFLWENQSDFGTDINEPFTSSHIDMLLPQYVLGYSSGENEILSLPFFKMRFVQFDEYYNALTQQLPYPGHPETRLAYLDNGFSQAILLCNLLFLDEDSLRPFREDVGIDSLQEFRIIVRRSVGLRPEQLTAFASEDENQNQLPEDIVNSNPALQLHIDEQGLLHYRLNITHLLEGDERSSLMINALQRCATLSYVDEVTDTLILDYRVNEATKQAFRENFDGSPLALFQAFQVLLALNLYVVSDSLKSDLYSSTSHYVSETVPTLASDERIMRFKHFYFRKRGVEKPMLLKELSDGEHQLLHSLGLCVLFRDTNCLLLLDEPETHFNPNWRASFITRLRQCLPDQQDVGQEMLITTHTPFLISDSKPDKVLVFSKDETTGVISISHPDYNTLGASINKITMNTFGKRETIGGYAQTLLEDLRRRFEAGGEDRESLITEIHQQLGDSVEKLLLINAILGQNAQDSEEEQS
ncbi:restriction system-associated AAA family ATPase [Escherichia coli]|uniref:restriction system-associated AAA family ATPase n=1 Tax=Escherichia coli TaxID=562 RepID=UPI001FF351F8|nr:restriction system-associated AAA family ATPase [Escherichia coli]